jgi:general secretion pathway protein C
MGSWAIMALNAVLFGGGCFLVADIVTQIAAEAIEPELFDSLARSDADQIGPQQRAAAPSVILDRNLFGAQLAGDVQVAPEPEKPLTRTKLPLRLLGTAASSSDSISRAAIENEKTRKHMVVAVGDLIEGLGRVRVEAIERTRVILDNQGQPEELLLHEGQPSGPAPTVKRAANRTSRRARRRAAPAGKGVRERLEKLAGQGGDGISKLLSQARISPKMANGEMLGMQIDAIKTGSFFETAGLRNGDVITEVNGVVLDRQEASAVVFYELLNADAIEITAQRGGTPIRLSAPPFDLAEQP